MADSNIGALPQAASLDDDSLLVAEQQGQAVKVTGAQFKEFGRQAVVAEVQDYVDQAQAAAESAAGAVSAVTDMTVEARTLDTGQPATVTKTTKNGVFNLAFGLPRGEQGTIGPEGPTGPRGPQGPPGVGLKILGNYDTEAELRAAVTAPEVGDAYGVGTEPPYDIYIYDGERKDWINYGPLSGGGGGIIPENVVTCEGGASMDIPAAFGDAPHVVTFTDEEEPPLTAEDIVYGEESVKEALDGLFTSVSDGKALIASAITDKGVPTAQDAAFSTMAENIGQIPTGGDTSDATATPGDILAGKTAYTAAGKVEGMIPTLGAQTLTPGTADQTIANGQYLGGVQTVKGDPNLTSSNIKKGVSIFGVAGAVEQNFLATLTVTADAGAVVTATHSGGTAVEALSTTGTVTLELPLEGTWTVTARRGVAQYNSVTINVTSTYSAALTAEVHIEYYGAADLLLTGRDRLAAASLEEFALFGGGFVSGSPSAVVDAYDKFLTHSAAENLSAQMGGLASASVNGFILFAGGAPASDVVDAYSAPLTRISAPSLNVARRYLAAAKIGDYALFAGGYDANGTTNAIDAYGPGLTHSEPVALALPTYFLAAAANDNYAIFAGGFGGSVATAYDKTLTRSIPSALSKPRAYLAAARAGNYVVFAGGNNAQSETVDAYDLFLTRTTPEVLSAGRYSLAGTTINGYAVFVGGEKNSTTGANEVDIYDAYLVRTTAAGLRIERSGLAATSIGNYGLFAGGRKPAISSVSYTNYRNVDVYQYV